MSTLPDPGLARQRATRIALRVIGAVLVGIGLLVGVPAGLDLVDAMGSDFAEDPGGGLVGRLALAGFSFVIGLGFLNAGFVGTRSRYVAGEVAPVVRDSASYLSQGRGIMNVGRTRASSATGPYCRACGVRNDDEARFCDGCGQALA